MAKDWTTHLDDPELSLLEELLLERLLDRGLEDTASRLLLQLKEELLRRRRLLGDCGGPPTPFDALGLSTCRGNGDAGSGISRRRHDLKLFDIALAIRDTILYILTKR